MSYRQGVDYFPLDVHMDEKIRLIKARFGLEGYAVLIILFQYIYSQGYWCPWSDDIALLFSDENRIEITKLKEILQECFDRNILNYSMYEKYQILTSKGIQERYFVITRKRKNVEVTAKYLLIDGTKTEEKEERTEKTKKKAEDFNKVKESKVNKSKVKERKENILKEKKINLPPHGDEKPKKKFGNHVLLADDEAEDLIKKYGEEQLKKAVDVMDRQYEKYGRAEADSLYPCHYAKIDGWLGGRGRKKAEAARVSQ